MSRTVILMAMLALLCVGCAPSSPPPKPASSLDQCLRREIFKQCLEAVPPGPAAPKYNDWAEVINECETAAFRQSYRLVEHIKPECRT